ncbi:hypothetical protein J7E83_19715, partial [Arthrobacter sp. ISL-48]|uniref:hypothetical protein n=1 Tax=Arthrobacter sp. ISL-48 TaxID=2819110 RepID=UPI001BE5F3AB
MDVLYAFIKSQELRALIEPTSPRPDAATAIFNLPDYRLFTVHGECSAVMGVHAAVLAALRNRIRV